MRLQNWYRLSNGSFGDQRAKALKDLKSRNKVGIKHKLVKVYARTSTQKTIGFYLGRKDDIERLKKSGKYIVSDD